MPRTVIVIAVILVALHGLVHLMGTAVYMQWTAIEGLPYKTALLGGRWEVGADGIRIFGVLWGLVALGFLAAATGLLFSADWWRAVLIGVTIGSLALSILDWETAYAGIAVNLLILAALWVGPNLTP